MAAVEIGPIEGVAIRGGGTALSRRELGNVEVLRSLPQPPRTEEQLQFLAMGAGQTLSLWRRPWAHKVGAPLDHAAQLISAALETDGALGRLMTTDGALPPTEAEIDLFDPHQTIRELIARVAAEAEISRERTFVNVERQANLGAAGWMAALVDARAEGRCPPGTRVLLAAVGGGMSWGAAVLRC